MPAVSEKQRRFMGAELARKRAGKKTRTGMSETQLEHFASKRRVHVQGGSMHDRIDIGNGDHECEMDVSEYSEAYNRQDSGESY